MAELVVLGEDGNELGYIEARNSLWRMDADGIFWNDETIEIMATARGRLAKIQLRGNKVLRSGGLFRVSHAVEVGSLIRISRHMISLTVTPHG